MRSEPCRGVEREGSVKLLKEREADAVSSKQWGASRKRIVKLSKTYWQWESVFRRRQFDEVQV